MDTFFLLERADVFEQKVDTLELSPVLKSYLVQCGYKTVGKLTSLNAKEFMDIYELGEKYYTELVEKLYFLGIEPVEMMKEDNIVTISSLKTYPQNLIATISKVNNIEIDNNIYNFDLKQGLSIALRTLPEREETMLLLRYKYCATLEKIGDYYGLSKERVRQIINEAMVELAEPNRRKLYEKGLRAYLNSVVEERISMKEKSLLFKEYMRGYENGYKDGIEGQSPQLQQEIFVVPIEELDLSVRSFRVLKRMGVNLVGEILMYRTADEIMKIRNLGSISAREIALKLTEYGICNEAWKEFLD